MRRITFVRSRIATLSIVSFSIFALMISVVAPAVAQAATTTATFDDRVTSGTNKFSYSGSWKNCVGCNKSAYKNSYKQTSVKSSSVTMTFTGTQAKLVGFKKRNSGIAKVYVDGKAVSSINYYASSTRYATLYTTPVLTQGAHTVKIVSTGTKSSSATGRLINIDKAIIYSGSSTPNSPTTPTTQSAVASITFDDGPINQYVNGRPVMQKYDLTGTYYIVSDSMYWGADFMSPMQVKQLYSEGNEIGNHTRDHSDLKTLSNDAVEAEFRDSQNKITSAVGVTPTACAYPYGSSNSSVEIIAAKYFVTCRSTQGGLNTSATPKQQLVNFYVTADTNIQDYAASINEAKRTNSWIIFTYHGIQKSNATDGDVTVANFDTQLNTLKQSGIPVKSVSTANASLR